MKIYNSALSPFGTRVMIAARLKNIAFEELPARGWIKTEAHLALNPIAKIPVMITDQGTAIAESEVMLRYLEDLHPNPSLLPATADDRARMNLLIRVTDIYVMTPVIRLFPHMNPDNRVAAIAEHEIGHWKQGLASLDHFLKFDYARPEIGLSLADCALPPAIHLCLRIAKFFDLGDIIAPYPNIVAYYEKMLKHPVINEALDALGKAQAGH